MPWPESNLQPDTVPRLFADSDFSVFSELDVELWGKDSNNNNVVGAGRMMMMMI